jgi:enamine deaminase RidA (YjgF/YER057c/UK114 family)
MRLFDTIGVALIPLLSQQHRATAFITAIHTSIMTHPSELRTDGSHNHPARHTTLSGSASHDDHTLRDGSHNHPPTNTMELIQSRLSELNLTLPPPGAPKANYQLVHRDGDLLYLSGHLPIKSDGTLVTGCLAPAEVLATNSSKEDPTHQMLSTQHGYEGAQHCALNLLSSLQSYLSSHVTRLNPTTGKREPADLSDVVKIVKLFGIVRSHPEFTELHLVMNGASDVLGHVLGKEVGGCHARSAIGTNTLPLGICVEVELIAKINTL